MSKSGCEHLPKQKNIWYTCVHMSILSFHRYIWHGIGPHTVSAMVSLIHSMLTHVTYLLTFTRGLLRMHIPDIRPHNRMLVKTILCHSIIPDDWSALHFLMSQETVIIIPCSTMFPKSVLLIYDIWSLPVFKSLFLFWRILPKPRHLRSRLQRGQRHRLLKAFIPEPGIHVKSFRHHQSQILLKKTFRKNDGVQVPS